MSHRRLPVPAATAPSGPDQPLGAGVRAFPVSPPVKRWRPSRSVAPVAHPPRKTVLVVDDEPVIRLLYKAMLHRMGLRVLETGDSVEALRLMQRRQVDLVISDLARPGLCGYEFIPIVRRRHPRLPILVFSGTAVPGVCAKIRALGARSCRAKPFDPRTLLTLVRRALPGRRRIPRAAAAISHRPTCRPGNSHRDTRP